MDNNSYVLHPAPARQRSFAPLKPPQRKPGTANPSPVLNALERKYQEALGKKKTLQEAEYEWQGFDGFEMAETYYLQRLSQIDATLASLENAIREFDPDWNRKRHMAPKVKRSSPLLPKGTLKPVLVKVLNTATEPLTVKEIAARVALELGLAVRDLDQKSRLYRATYNALRSAYDRGCVKCLDCHPNKWFSASLTSH